MKAVLALIVIYVGTFLVAIQGASNSSVEASEQSAPQGTQPLDPAKEKDIRSLLELVGARDAIEDARSSAIDQYRQKVIEASSNKDRAQAFTNAYLAGFQKRFDADQVNSRLVGSYDQHFTDEEIKGLLEFYGSPLGQKVAAEMPKIGREVQQATRTSSNEAARLAWQDLRAEYPNAGETVRARRHGLARNASNQTSELGPAATQQASADQP
jgi:hypothetical protein